MQQKGQLLVIASVHQSWHNLEELIDRYYLGDKDEEKLQEGLYAGLLYGLDDPYSRYYTAEEYDSENSSNEGSYVGIGILMEKNKEGGSKDC